MSRGALFEVVLLRRNGRYVKARTGLSRYRAKVQRREWERKYDAAYYVEIRPCPGIVQPDRRYSTALFEKRYYEKVTRSSGEEPMTTASQTGTCRYCSKPIRRNRDGTWGARARSDPHPWYCCGTGAAGKHHQPAAAADQPTLDQQIAARYGQDFLDHVNAINAPDAGGGSGCGKHAPGTCNGYGTECAPRHTPDEILAHRRAAGGPLHEHRPGAGGCAYGLATGAWWARCGGCGERIWSHRGKPEVWFQYKLRQP